MCVSLNADLLLVWISLMADYRLRLALHSTAMNLKTSIVGEKQI